MLRTKPPMGTLRLHMTADRIFGVLLLDHTREITTAMIGFLRRLRGGIIGALLVWILIRTLNASVCATGAAMHFVCVCR